MKDYYEILGINPGVYQEEIKPAFRKLAKKYHPDRWYGEDVIFREIKEAYDCLSDVKKRRIYDSIFMNDFSIEQTHLPIKVELFPENVLSCLPVKITYTRKNVCSCKGKEKDCKFCVGSGVMQEDIDMIFRETDKYPDGLTFTVDDAGNMDKYGEHQDVIVKMEYVLPHSWEYVHIYGEMGYFIRTINISHEEVKKQISEKGSVDVYIDKVGWFSITSNDLPEIGNIVNTNHPRLKIKLNIMIENIKSFWDITF